MASSLAGKAALITGASQGLGLAIAMNFVKNGADLLICARNAEALNQAHAQLMSHANGTQRIVPVVADVANTKDVETLKQTLNEVFPNFSILVNNAGVYGPKGKLEDIDMDAWIEAIQINLLGSVFMTKMVLPFLKAKKQGKIIQLSGGGATNPMPYLTAYATSKAAIVRFVESMSLEVAEYGIDMNLLAPGALNTRLLDDILTAGPEIVGQAFYAKALEQQQSGGASLDNAAQAACFLASKESDGITGKLVSAVWDPWQDLPKYKEILKKSDIYTLRRIVPKDRGYDWE